MDRAPPDRPRSVLGERTLVLNRSWVPIHLTTVRRALVMLFQHSAVAVEPETYTTYDFEQWLRVERQPGVQIVRTPSYFVPVPSVILLSKYDRLPGCNVPFSRRNLSRRDQHRCQYCGHRQSNDQLTIDHVVPRSRGGTTGWTNCVLACIPCNRKKGCRTPEQAGMKLLATPTRPDWALVMAVESGNPEVLQRFQHASHAVRRAVPA
jgi:5-methylcytosine-specific restriction endonuclease McrA